MFSSIDESNDSFFYPFIVVFNVADVPRNRPTELAPVLPVFLPLEIPQKHGEKKQQFFKKDPVLKRYSWHWRLLPLEKMIK